MRPRDSRLSENTLLQLSALCTSCLPRYIMGTCSDALLYWLSYLYVQNRRQHGLRSVRLKKAWKLENSLCTYRLFNITYSPPCVTLLNKSMFHTLSSSSSLPTIQLTFKVLLDHVQTSRLSFITQFRAASPVRESLVSVLFQHIGLILNHSCDLKPWEFSPLKLQKQLCAQDRRWQNRVGGGGTNIWLESTLK